LAGERNGRKAFSTQRHIRTVAKANGIHTRIGWHIFRRTFGTLLKANGEDVKTVQELLRHANSRITLEVYTQAVTSHKRAAQTKVVRVMVSLACPSDAPVLIADKSRTTTNRVSSFIFVSYRSTSLCFVKL
jgi:Phage integrase family